MATKPKSVTSKPNDQAILMKIVSEFQDSSRAEIKKWRSALDLAKHPEKPRLYVLQDLYENLKSDGHFISQTGLRKAAVIGSKMSVIDKKTGKKDQEKTDALLEEWFFDLLDIILEVPIKGYSVVELVDFAKPEFKLIPRRNIAPLTRELLLEVSADKGIPYSDFIGVSILEIGRPGNLGLMADLCGQLIWKRNAQQSWAEYSEKFGMPLISATTNKTSTAEINRVKTMLKALGEAAQAVLPEGTTLKVDQFTSSDSYNVYDKQIERINSEIGKPITGGTMISDNGSSRSQAQVHENNLDEKIAMFDKLLVQFTVNGRLFPLLAQWGFPFNPETDKFVFEESWMLDLDKYWTIVKDMIDEGYVIDENWLSQTFNVPITGKVEKQPATPQNPKVETRPATSQNPKPTASLFDSFV